MQSSSLDAIFTKFKTKSSQKLFRSDYLTLYTYIITHFLEEEKRKKHFH